MHTKTKTLIVVGWAAAMGLTAFAGGSKRTAETCTEDGECSRGHCHTKENDRDKVCVDCTSSEISNYRGQIHRFCKTERGCSKIPQGEEVSEDFFKDRIELNDRCIAARESENKACWNGGDRGHQQQVDVTEGTRRICLEEWNTRKGLGGLYTCSDSTYATRAGEVTDACSAYGDACKAWQKDDKLVDCNDIETAMKKTDRCVDAVERLDNDCLPRLSPYREA